MKTMMCLILDRSGSMAGREGDTATGVNNLVAEQQKNPDPATIACVRFDQESGVNVERFRPMVDIRNFQPLEKSDVQARGGTPLNDAIGLTLQQLDEDWKREQPQRAVVVIVTDGQENASFHFTKAQVKRMVEARQESGMWSFIFLGADINSFAESSSYGVSSQNTANYSKTSAGIKTAFGTVSASMSATRTTGQTLHGNLGGDIDEDGTIKNKVDPQVDQKWKTPPTQTWTPPGPTGGNSSSN